MSHADAVIVESPSVNGGDIGGVGALVTTRSDATTGEDDALSEGGDGNGDGDNDNGDGDGDGMEVVEASGLIADADADATE